MWICTWGSKIFFKAFVPMISFATRCFIARYENETHRARARVLGARGVAQAGRPPPTTMAARSRRSAVRMHSLPLLLILAAADLHGALQALHNFKRRDMLALHAASCVVCPAFASGIMSSTSIHVAASWSATDGFSDASFISFDEGAYAAMRDDARRTPLFAEAIQKRLAGQPGELTVLDIGTGPFALLALIAARAGAKKVYAIEASKEAAKRARKTIAAAKDVPPGTITVIEGFSTQIALDEKVDLVSRLLMRQKAHFA
eukprot:917977-Pleurochrysis_carterae.AAC.2